LIHGAWIDALRLDAAYVPFSPAPTRILPFLEGLRGGAVVGLNVTAPFKETASLAADRRSPAAEAAGAANLLVFKASGEIEADNTDGEGLLYAISRQAPDIHLSAASVALIGAGGAARGALLALYEAGVRDLRVINRTQERAEHLADLVEGARAFPMARRRDGILGAHLVINATPGDARQAFGPGDWDVAAADAVALDMVYRPLLTPFLQSAAESGRHPVDGLEMLIGQAIPSFRRLFGVAPPEDVDVRALGRGEAAVIRLGLTGSIGMGKSTTAGLFRAAGAPVYDADAAVHALYATGGGGAEALSPVFPDAIVDGAVDRPRLSHLVMNDPDALRRLEAVIHPLLGRDRAAFMAAAAFAPLVVFDIPLLFETGGEGGVDAVAVVTCAPEEQRRRVLERPGMTLEKFEAILKRQLPDAEKRARADFIIDTGHGLKSAQTQVDAVIAALAKPEWRRAIS
jgi:shikimate dehydrogenase